MGSGPSVRSVARRALRTIRRHWRPLLIIATVIFVPLGMIDVADERIGDVEIEELSNLRAVEIAAIGFVHAATALFGEIFFAGVVAGAIAETQGGRAPTVGELISSLPYVTLIAIDVILSLAVALGLLLLVIPGVLIFGYFALAAPLAKVEHLRTRDAFRRSRRLVRGHLLLVLGILLPVILGGELIGELITEGGGDLLGESVLAEFAGAFLSEVIVTPLWAFAAVSLTYELLDHEGRGTKAR